MARTSNEYTYNVDTLAHLSGWTRNRVHQDVSREGLDVSHLREAAIWLAANGSPEVRAEMARRLIAPVLGARRRTEDNQSLYLQASSYDLMYEIFKRDRSVRDTRARKIRTKRRAGGRA